MPRIKLQYYSIKIQLESGRKFKKTDKKTRRILTVDKMHHPKADIGRLYVKRKGGGRALLTN